MIKVRLQSLLELCEAIEILISPEDYAALMEEINHDPLQPFRYYEGIRLRVKEDQELEVVCLK